MLVVLAFSLPSVLTMKSPRLTERSSVAKSKPTRARKPSQIQLEVEAAAKAKAEAAAVRKAAKAAKAKGKGVKRKDIGIPTRKTAAEKKRKTSSGPKRTV